MSDAALSPTSVVDGMIGLHGRDHMQLSEAVEVLGRHVLRVLNAPAAITPAMCLFDVAVNVEDRGDSSVSDSMGEDLQSSSVSLHHAIAHKRDGVHLVREQAAIAGLVRERFEEIRRGRPKRAIRVGLHRADAQVWTAKRPPDADLHLIVHLRDQGGRIDARGQLAFVEQFGVDRDIGVVRVHVLHAGHAERSRVFERALNGVASLIVAGRWNRFEQQILGCVFKRARRISLPIADDHSACGIGCLRADPRPLQG